MEQKVDYIIVGFGIAGATFAQQARLHGKSVLVIDGQKPSATRTAAGTLNPVALRRITAVWKVQEFFHYARDFYTHLQSELQTPFLKKLPIYRYFHDTEEQNDWLVASDRKDLSPYLDPQVHHFPNEPWNHPMGFGRVKQSMRLDTILLLDSFRELLYKEGRFLEEAFVHDDLESDGTAVSYHGIQAKYVLFAEGVHAQGNPFFPSSLLIPKKGEYIIIKAPELQLESVLKGRYFFVPLGGDLYKVGATFAHGDTTYEPTKKGKEELMKAVEKRLKVPFEWVDQVVGHRPTVKDRRPLLGSISEGSPYYFFNGLGTRGVLLAPYLSKCLFQNIEEGLPLDREMDIRRFIS